MLAHVAVLEDLKHNGDGIDTRLEPSANSGIFYIMEEQSFIIAFLNLYFQLLFFNQFSEKNFQQYLLSKMKFSGYFALTFLYILFISVIVSFIFFGSLIIPLIPISFFL